MDFLTFKEFISIPVLIIFYYLGAIVFPFVIWIVLIWLTKKYKLLGEAHNKGKQKIWKLLNTKQRVKLVIAFIMAFLFMELFWRMLFEFLIAYMQMRDALLQ
jgi:uncharacterized membrane protein